MAEPGVDDEDLFADLYDGDDNADASEPVVRSEPEPNFGTPPQDFNGDDEPTIATGDNSGPAPAPEVHSEYNDNQQSFGMDGVQTQYRESLAEEKPILNKEDGKMFIGGLNWETTDESLKNYFSQFGEVIECTVMRDGATGRSRGFGFLTFKDPKHVNIVMVKEHQLDGKLIDPKRAIPRDEQERTAKIFVGGVSQEATEHDFKEFFNQFGNVLDATLMMDKDTGRPRGFGFVTFDSDRAVERTLEGPLAILNKPIEVKRAQPRGKMGEEDQPKSKWQPRGQNQGFGSNNGGAYGGGNQMGAGGGDANAGNGQNPNNMTPAMMAQYWQRMQQYFAMMQANQMGGGMGQMNPMMQQMMMQRMQQQGGGSPGPGGAGGMGNMTPQMMQQMASMQGYPGGMQGGGGGSPNGGNGQGGAGRGQGFSPQDQLMFEQQKYERQQMARMNGMPAGQTWDGMYDDMPNPEGDFGDGNGYPTGPSGGNRGRGGFRGGRGNFNNNQNQNRPPSQPPNAPANAPTGPKNAGRPGANYRGGGRGAHRGFHPYARGGG